MSRAKKAAPTTPATAKPKTKKATATPAEAEPTAAASEVPAAPVVAATRVTRVIELDPEDTVWATWRKRPALKRPEPVPFDFESCRKRLAKIPKSKFGWIAWDDADIAPILSRKEAHFWFLAMTSDVEKLTPAEIAAEISEQEVTGTMTIASAVARMKGTTRFQPGPAVRALFNLFDGTEVVELLQNPAVVGLHWEAGTVALTEFTRHVFPYLGAADVKQLKDELRPLIDPKDWPTDHYQRPPMAFFLAALVGMPDELLAVVRSIPDHHYAGSDWNHSYYHQTQRMVFGLGSPQVVEAEMRRLKLAIQTPEFVRAWLALTEFAGLDYARDNILAETSKDECEQLIQVFAHVKAPDVAPHMLELKLNSKAPALARKWLDEQTANAITGLLPTATGRGKLAEAAVDFLRDAKKKGHEPLIRAAIAQAEPQVAEAIRKSVLDFIVKEYPELDAGSMPEELRGLFESAAKEKKGKLPAWADLTLFPPILIGGHRLSEAQTTLVLEGLQRSRIDPKNGDVRNGLVIAVKKHADPASLDAFAWKLFQLWQGEGYPPKEKWAMSAVGLLGGDGSALKLTPLIRNWPGESQHQRAVFGLECLRAIGSDTALMQLNGISQKLKFAGLKKKAALAMEAIAKEKGLTRAELEDRVVPDCDLDERGQRVFDFGARQFRFVLGADMKPMIKDADGKVKTDLPKPGAKDDAAKGAEAVAAWKLMKKQIKEVAKLQADRLEQAMVVGRRWPVADFQSLLVKHPLMVHLVRLLLWGGYDNTGKLTTTFRVTEDQTFADAKDAATTLAGVATVGIVHPLNLSDEQRAAWGEVFGDYEIVPPFPQLGRSIHRLEKDELTATVLTRYSGVTLPAPSLVFGLEKFGWVRGGGGDGGSFSEHSKPFPGSGVTAFVEYDGAVGYGYIDPNETISFKDCYFVSGGVSYSYKANRLSLGEVDPVAVSEVLSDLSTLAAKAK